MNGWRFLLRCVAQPRTAGRLTVALCAAQVSPVLQAQTYAPPATGDYGGPGPYAVFVDGFTNLVYPTANGQTLTVSVYHPNATINIGFAGHSYGGGFLPAVIQHAMMGKADQFRGGHNWGGGAAFMYSMAPGYAFGGGGETGVAGAQTISFPTNLNVIEQVFNDDTSIADPRVALDVFYNITTLNSQKEFLTVHGDSHGTPAQVANHFLPNSGSGVTSTSLQAWAIFRHIDALAAYTFTSDATARQIALGNGTTAESYTGRWSDGTNVARLGITDLPSPSAYATGPYVVQWSDAANPRSSFPLVSGPPGISRIGPASGQVSLTATGLLVGHSYVEQTAEDVATGNWSNAVSFVAAQVTQSFTNAINASSRFWRIYAP